MKAALMFIAFFLLSVGAWRLGMHFGSIDIATGVIGVGGGLLAGMMATTS